MQLLMLSVHVAPSTHGDGVYASIPFKSGQWIGRVFGDVMPGDEGSEYAIDLGEDRLLEPGPPFRFLNHSCEPNCELLNLTTPGRWRDYEVYVRAIRSIAVGDELTIDYAWHPDAAIRCGCQSARCRGWIVSEDQLEEVRQREGS
jgi:hypothetical protein